LQWEVLSKGPVSKTQALGGAGGGTKYRKLAKKREYAEKVVNPDDKHAWLLLVEEWSRLADRAEPLEEAGSKSDGSSHR
jgi:hypothetical protein